MGRGNRNKFKGSSRPAGPGRNASTTGRPHAAGPRRDQPKAHPRVPAASSVPRRTPRPDPFARVASPHEFLYGVNAVVEALRAGRRRCYALAVSRTIDRDHMTALQSAATAARISVTETDAEILEQKVGDVAFQGVVGAFGSYPWVSLEELARPKKDGSLRRVVVLDSIQDPQNVGAILRTAEVAGFDGAIMQDRRAASITPAAVKASAGATEHMRVARVTNTVDAVNTLKQNGFWAASLDMDGQSIYEVDLQTIHLVLVVGSEGRGVRPGLKNVCDLSVALPQHGRVGSLNASAAAAAAIYQALSPRKV